MITVRFREEPTRYDVLALNLSGAAENKNQTKIKHYRSHHRPSSSWNTPYCRAALHGLGRPRRTVSLTCRTNAVCMYHVLSCTALYVQCTVYKYIHTITEYCTKHIFWLQLSRSLSIRIPINLPPHPRSLTDIPTTTTGSESKELRDVFHDSFYLSR
ncbi:hypothetical protein BU24DRAFT_158072 [Aaosphaeria arxii CBS 175.79]|uniref:Uncharacterized protein n=1 Tax=Aaosphaeria arxii CBS 175.79 TaxID=1450172 RepID=A0A6A5XX72_9PLEO|nr:uncharacterized protein BU24DRAFT_158072 [Aaosphaeria arxii CBS 175.79]KAF2017762.1 hypothetical protein BU24DRAFT_158072 [Aaosphaeria arxii CBS 175.79]